MCVCLSFVYLLDPNLLSLLLEVTVPGGVYDRDAVKANIPLLTDAIKALGLRVGVNLCTVHIKALYAKIVCRACMQSRCQHTHSHIYLLLFMLLAKEISVSGRAGR